MFIPTEEYERIQIVLPILCVDVMLIYQKKCLLLKRLNHPAKGQWWFPGGRVLKNESIEKAAARKSFAETGLSSIFAGVISVEETMFPQLSTMQSEVHTVNVCCKMLVEDISGLRVDKDHETFRFVDLTEASVMELHAAVLNPLTLVLKTIAYDFQQTASQGVLLEHIPIIGSH